MKRVYVNEEWCLGCHLCEYNCAFANSNEDDMILACKDKSLDARITIEDRDHTGSKVYEKVIEKCLF